MRVLVVEDEALIARQLTAALSDAGYAVVFRHPEAVEAEALRLLGQADGLVPRGSPYGLKARRVTDWPLDRSTGRKR